MLADPWSCSFLHLDIFVRFRLKYFCSSRFWNAGSIWGKKQICKIPVDLKINQISIPVKWEFNLQKLNLEFYCQIEFIFRAGFWIFAAWRTNFAKGKIPIMRRISFKSKSNFHLNPSSTPSLVLIPQIFPAAIIILTMLANLDWSIQGSVWRFTTYEATIFYYQRVARSKHLITSNICVLLF